MFPARAITSATAATDTADCRIVIIFAQRISEMTSLAAKEIALVNERQRQPVNSSIASRACGSQSVRGQQQKGPS